jgi:hypothetical protein
MKTGYLLPKIRAIGSLHLEWRRCGRANCCCARGALHGPYFVRRWREGGRQRKALVRRDDVVEVLTAIKERRAAGSILGITRSLRGVSV